MPRVPTYDEFQTAPQVLGPTRVDAPMSPAMAAIPGQQQQQSGQAAIQSGNAQAQIALDMQRDVNDAATKEADNAAAQALNTLLHDPKSGYLNTQGKEALDRREDAQKYAQDNIEKAGESLTNDMQRRMFTEVARRRLLMAQEQINVHAAAQTKVYNETETTKRIDNSRKDAVANWTMWNTGKVLEDGTKEPNAYSTAKATMIGEANHLAALKGFGPDSETAKSLRMGQTTMLHADVINTMLAADKTRDAKAYYEKNSEEIDPEKRSEFKKMLNTASVADDALKISRVVSILGEGSITKQREELDRLYALPENDPDRISAEVYKAAMSELHTRHSEQQAEANEKKIKESDQVSTDALSIKKSIDKDFAGKSLSEKLAQAQQWYDESDKTPHAGQVFDNLQARLKQDYATNKAEEGDLVATKATALERSLNPKDSLQAQIAAINKWYDSSNKTSSDTSVRDGAIARIKDDYQLKKAIQAEGEKSVIGNATDWFVQHPGASILDFQKVNPKAYDALKNNGHLSGIVAFAKGNKVETDPAVWAQVLTNQQELKAMTPTEIYNRYRLKLDDSHLDRLYAMNAALNGSKDEQHLSIMSNTEMVKNSAVKMNILPASGKPSDSQSRAFDDFQSQIDARVASYESTNLQGKRKANQEELKKILQEVEMDKVYQRRTLFPNKEVPLISVPASEMSSAYVKIGEEEIPIASIPASQRALIIPALRAAGKPATEQNIADFWVRGGKRK